MSSAAPSKEAQLLAAEAMRTWQTRTGGQFPWEQGASAGADKAWAPFVQARTAGSPGEPRTCDQLGVCQNLRPRCRACPEYLDAAELDAPLTPFEQIGYWAALGSLVIASVAVVAGAAGWVYATYF